MRMSLPSKLAPCVGPGNTRRTAIAVCAGVVTYAVRKSLGVLYGSQCFGNVDASHLSDDVWLHVVVANDE